MNAPSTVWVREPHVQKAPPLTRDRLSSLPTAPRFEKPVAIDSDRASLNEALVCSLVGRNLRRLRRQQGFSLEQLAAHSGVSRAMLGQVEQGKSIPSIKTLWQVAKALGVSVSWFLESTHDESVLLLQPPVDSPLVLDEGDAELRPLQQARDGHQEAFYELRLAPGGTVVLPVSSPVRRVNVAVSQGVLDVILEGQRHLVRPRESLQYESVEDLTWRNNGQVQVQAFVLVRTVAHRGVQEG